LVVAVDEQVDDDNGHNVTVSRFCAACCRADYIAS
jgi:hypothetical protein